MADERIHRAVSADGTEIAGRVQGEGPPLVLVHGDLGDGEFAWDELLPHLTDRFTCYTPSTRGRGLSADSSDHSPPRVHGDLNAFVDSIDEPVFLASWSGPGLAFGAAAHCGNVAGVAAYEPIVPLLVQEDDQAHIGGAFEQVGMAAADGRLVDAIHAFAPGFMTDDEIAALEKMDFFERWAGGIPAMLRAAQEHMSYEGPWPTDPEVLGKITAPVLLLLGEQTLLATAFGDSAQHIDQHVTDARVRELPGLGHFAPVLAPETLAEELISFFASVRQTA